LRQVVSKVKDWTYAHRMMLFSVALFLWLLKNWKKLFLLWRKPKPEPAVHQADGDDEVDRIMAELKPLYREVVTLCRWETRVEFEKILARRRSVPDLSEPI
jgi:hypothetical protein